jgi:uncharacterized protein YjiS (DUF1127 family)
MRKIMKTIDIFPNAAGCISSHQATMAPSLLGRIQANLSHWHQAWQRRRQAQRDLNHVSHFSPYLLRDIGLSAEDIASIQPKLPFASKDTVGRPG